MAKIATEVLKIGFTVAALPGNVVTASDEDIEKWGWTGKFEDDGNDVAPDAAPAPARGRAVPAEPAVPAGS